MIENEKVAIYLDARQRIGGLTAQPGDPIAAMASVAAVLFELLPAVSWAGFYRVVEPELLRVGPYQGSVGCLEISFSQGVCGAAAREMQTQVVQDVHAFPGHIACDSLTLSEIVVPITDALGALVAVLDLDSHRQAAFDDIDRVHLEKIAELLQKCFTVDDQVSSTV